MEYGGSDLLEQDKDSIELCADLAFDIENATFWTYKTKTKKCLLKDSNNDRRDNTPDHVSGSSECGYANRYDWETGGEYPRRVFLNSHYGPDSPSSRRDDVALCNRPPHLFLHI